LLDNHPVTEVVAAASTVAHLLSTMLHVSRAVLPWGLAVLH
jgi:hypothetical protein